MKRIARWLRYRLIIPVFRSGHSAEFTARGVANGVFWGLTPSVGLQTIQIVVTWFVARKVLGRDSSLLQAFIWVWVNNPITMIPLYYMFYVTGLWLTGDARSATDYTAFVDLWSANAEAGWRVRVGRALGEIGVPLVIGCLPYAIAGAFVSYRWAVSIIRGRRLRLDARTRLAGDPAPPVPLE